MTPDEIDALVYANVLQGQTGGGTVSYASDPKQAFQALLIVCNRENWGFVMMKGPTMPLVQVQLQDASYAVVGKGEDELPSLAICTAMLHAVKAL